VSYIKNNTKKDQQQRLDSQVDVVRDKITKWADRVVVGQYTGEPEKERNEGEIWTDVDGKKWIIKNGIKQSIRKTQGAAIPYWCPKCERVLNHWLQEQTYQLRGACYDCWLKYDTKLRKANLFEAYDRRRKWSNEKDWLIDLIAQREDYIKNFKSPQLHFQDGRWEELAHKGLFKDALAAIAKDIQFLKNRYDHIEKEEAKDAVEQRKLGEWEQENPWSAEPNPTD